ncbi:CAP domain-containing protein [Nonomuraea rhodomycinica]|uniref:CAP domain-containing protein n=2 Tax=Nonomuraea rhodomycinica TaxID=1712872 RepID=A0A7Y6IPP6_9ACTN|nr:CAP domain-containing protein [Nonomuraea rhodomycinica]
MSALALGALPPSGPAHATSRAARADCAFADDTVRTPQWYRDHNPDWDSGRVQAAVALNEAFADNAVRCLVNAERTARGLPALREVLRLFNAADAHTKAAKQIKWWVDGANFHVNPRTGSGPGDRVRAAGYCSSGTWQVLENVYQGWGTGGATPRAAVAWWMGSPPHRAALLDARMAETGVSVRHGSARPGVTSDHQLVATQVFGVCR